MKLLLGILLLVAMALATLLIITLIGVWMSRDEKRHGASGSLGSAMLEMQSLIEPGRKKVIEAKRQAEESEEQDAAGDPPVT